MKLTTREKDIMYKLLQAKSYLTAESIAKELKLSSRTVLREVEVLEYWLSSAGFSLDKKTGRGIRIKGLEKNGVKIKKLLEEAKEQKVYSPEERVSIIISKLLESSDTIKLYSLSKILNVTEATLSNDLRKVEELLKDKGLALIKKPGTGIQLIGEESLKRKVLIDFIYNELKENQIYQIILDNNQYLKAQKEKYSEMQLPPMLDSEDLIIIEGVLKEHEGKRKYRLEDGSHIGLVIHLALTIKRIKNNENIKLEQQLYKELTESREFILAEELLDMLSAAFKIKIPREEIGYITVHLQSAGILKPNQVVSSEKENLEEIVQEIIKNAEGAMGYILKDSEFVKNSLITHISASIKRISLNMDIRNPLLKEIKEAYPRMFLLAKKSSIILEKRLKLKLPEEEVGYIAMHLAAAFERSEKEIKRKYRIVVACPSGLGASVLLSANLKKHYDSLDIVEVISIIHLSEQELLTRGIDFIVSTIEFKTKQIPLVAVNPFLTTEDKEKLDAFINKLAVMEKTQESKDFRNDDLKGRLTAINNYIEGILQIMKSFSIESLVKDTTIEEVFEMLKEKALITEEVLEDLRKREELGSTVSNEGEFMLLHCRSEHVDKLIFKLIRVENALKHYKTGTDLEAVRLILLMVAPKIISKEILEVMAFISESVIDNSRFLSVLKNESLENTEKELNSLLDSFFISRVDNIYN